MKTSAIQLTLLFTCLHLTGVWGPAAAESAAGSPAFAAHSLSAPGNEGKGFPVVLPVLANLALQGERDRPPAGWTEGSGLSDDAREMIRRIGEAERDGLDPSDYHYEALQPLLAGVAGEMTTAQIEELIGDAAVKFIRDLRLGRLGGSKPDAEWFLKQESFPAEAALHNARAGRRLGGFLRELGPATDAYERLRNGLDHYRELEEQGGWRQLPAGPLLRPGGVDARIPALRQRLAVEGDYLGDDPEDSHRYSHSLEAAVRRFQQRHGLKIDGIVGPATLRELNVPFSRRLAQIRANLERWRWLPHRLGERYVLVNSAGFELRMVENDRTVLLTRSISGRPERRTPSFSSRLTTVVVNPSWTVPFVIAVEDLLPLQQQDAEYFSRKRIQVISVNGSGWRIEDPGQIDWMAYDEHYFPFILRQLPGDQNSLGRVKFDMPNPYAVYLHDTPAKGLFEEAGRAFSSGCIRVQQPIRLASLLLNLEDDGGGEIVRMIEAGETSRNSLPGKVPVYVVYFTAWVDELDKVHFTPDIYGLDDPLIEALDGHQAGPVRAREGEPTLRSSR